LPLGPVVSVTSEVLLLAPLAIAWIVLKGAGAGGGNEIGTHVLLAISGPLTAGPLVLFSFAARRVRMSTVGLVQFLNPSLQFASAALVLGEIVTRWHAIAFPIIWAGLVVYSVSLWRQDRAAAKASSKVVISGTA
jgi:chloramphenicol-sensitive protein RarD